MTRYSSLLDALPRCRRLSALSAAAGALLLGSQVASAQAPRETGTLTADGRPSRIVGGGANSGDPSVPLLVVYGNDGEQSICSGSLVASRWILTAAHCVDSASLGFEPAAIEAYFGTEYTETDPGFAFYTFADNFIFHETWNASDLAAGSDIALVHLEQDVPLPVIPLMPRPLAQQDLGAQVRLIGWGITAGGRDDSGLKRQVVSTLFDFDETLLQIGDASTNICNGDSGGPAVTMIDGQEVQIGVTSFGDPQCAEFGVDTRVDAFVDWIATSTNGEVAPQTAPIEPSRPAGPAGSSCQSDTDCAGGVCVSDGAQGRCTDRCQSTVDCAQGLECFATEDPQTNVCWPAEDPSTTTPLPGGSGGSFPDAGDDDDVGGDDDDSDADDDDEGGGGSADDSESGGCSVSRGSGSPGALLALLAFGTLCFRRRRYASHCET